MTDQKKAILVLCGIALVIIVLFIMGVSFNTQDQPVSADDFNPQEFPVFAFMSDILGNFAPKLEREELTRMALPRTFRVQPSQRDQDLRKAEFCISPVSRADSIASIIISYRASRAQDRFDNLREQECTLSVRDTERFPSCCNLMMLESSGELRFRSLQGNSVVLLSEREILRL